MTIAKLCSICKKTKKVHTFVENDIQWVGDGYAYYALPGLPKFKTDELLAVFGVDEDDKSLWFCSEEELTEINVREDCTDETPVLFDSNFYICKDGTELLPLKAADKTYFIDKAYLKPLKMDANLSITMRKAGMKYYFVCKDGLFCMALIMPVKTGPELKEKLSNIVGSI